MTEYKPDSQIEHILDYLRHNAGVAISASYLLLTLYGIFYASVFYGKFDIAIMKLADIADLLIAGISEPAALLLFSGSIIIAAVFDWVFQKSYPIQQKWKAKPPSFKRVIMLSCFHVPKSQLTAIFYLVVIYVLYAFVFVAFYADWQSTQIRNGDGIKILLNAEGVESKELLLLGSTSNYLFTYDVEAKQAQITPVEVLTSLVPMPEPDQAADVENDA